MISISEHNGGEPSWMDPKKQKQKIYGPGSREKQSSRVRAGKKKKPSPAKGRVITDCLGYEGHVWEKTE